MFACLLSVLCYLYQYMDTELKPRIKKWQRGGGEGGVQEKTICMPGKSVKSKNTPLMNFPEVFISVPLFVLVFHNHPLAISLQVLSPQTPTLCMTSSARPKICLHCRLDFLDIWFQSRKS